MSNFTGFTKGNALAAEMKSCREREERWSLQTSGGGQCSCLHGFVFWPGEKNPCPVCAAARAAQEIQEESRRDSLVTEARSESERVFDEGIPLVESQVIEVATCDDGKWFFIPVTEFLLIAPEARVVSLPGGQRKVVSSRMNPFGLNFK
jgi:hypothetical protein